ncbi:MAG TPA: FAD-dependent oxidoreductase [Candidatus Mailhella excrementigallinarum]|nr:MAG: FAD-dependent oxidoreductase [Desulfovibrionaceae bacterium]HIV65971.1 FAD-dependent oxidoreductase [Candidatus Mailhella excrementigallinarum]
MLNVQRILDTDILIVGGGIAGLMAAICAGEQGIATIVAEKAHVRRSGSGATGNDHFLCFMPEIQKITLKEMINEMMAGQVGPWHDTLLTKVFLERTAEMVHRWHSWGINMKPFGPDYVYMGHAFPDRPRMYVKYDGHNQKEILVKKAKENGALFLNHHPVTDLLAEDGRVTGALLMDVREDEPRFTLVRAGAVIMATGCSTRLYPNSMTPAMLFNSGFCPSCAGGMASAYRIGARLVNMEHPYTHAGTRYFARCGKATWIGVYKYPDGRPIGPFVRRPDREIGDNTSDVWKSVFADLMANGTGPAYLDCTEASPEDLEFMRQGMISEGLTSQLDYMDREGIDPARHAVEFGRYEPLLFGRGLEIDETGSTNIKGLYVAGDPIGNFRSGIAGAVTWGWISAENASRHVKEAELSERTREDPLIAARLALYEKLLRRENGAPWQEFNIALQQLMNDYCPPAPRVRSETLLRAGLKYMGDLRAHALRDMAAPNSHTLMRGLEVLDLVDLGEAVMTAARERRETRVQHIRSDCPFTSLSDGEKFINVELKNGRPVTSWRRRRML